MSVTKHDAVLAIATEPVMVKTAGAVTEKGYAGDGAREKSVAPNAEKRKGTSTTDPRFPDV